MRFTDSELAVLAMVSSREIIEYRGSPYLGVREYVEEWRRIRRKVKRIIEERKQADGAVEE